MILKTFLLILFIIWPTEPAKILGIYPTPAKSHFSLGFQLMSELVKKGHEVTLVSPFPQEVPLVNYTDIPVESMNDVILEFKNEFYNRELMDLTTSTTFIHEMSYKLTEKLLSHENFQKLLNSNQKFDIIVMEYFLNEATMSIGHRLNAPIVLTSSLPSSAFTNHLFANPAPVSYVPFLLSPYTGNMDFWERASNLFINLFDTFYKNFVMLPRHDALIKSFVSKDVDVNEAMHNASLMLLNSHPTVTEPVPHTPNMIEIGGFHITHRKSLPEDIQDFLDSAKDGAIYFSMGSNLKSSDLTKEKRDALAASFAKLDQKVLWKYEDVNNDLKMPSNVKLVKWLPQQDVLAHRNIKAFITHGGLLSMIETVYFGMPAIGIPIYGDQKLNVARAVENGLAVLVPFRELNEERLDWALSEVLDNPRYAKKAEALSDIIRDRETHPLDTGVFWIEHMIKHNGVNYMRSPGVRLTWFQRKMIDVIIVLIIIEVICFIVFYYIIKHIIHRIIKNMKLNKTEKYSRLNSNTERIN